MLTNSGATTRRYASQEEFADEADDEARCDACGRTMDIAGATITPSKSLISYQCRACGRTKLEEVVLRRDTSAPKAGDTPEDPPQAA